MKKILVTVLFLLCSLATAQDDVAIDSLRGMNGFDVVVEPFDSILESNGLSASSVKLEIEQQLQSAGIKVLSKEVNSQRVGSPYLYIRVNCVENKSGVYAFSINITLNQTVYLVRTINTYSVASTWGKSTLGIIEQKDMGQIMRYLRALMVTFIRDYSSVNPN
jgi:hypothetical protein